MFNHLVYLLTLELFQSSWATFWAEPSATMPSGLVNSTIMVVVFYKILARRLVKWLKFAIKSTWKTRWLLLYNNDPPEDFGLIFSERLAEVAIELILPSGGRECEVWFTVAPRRNGTDQTWVGHHLLDPAWLYIALSRASKRSYVLTEDVTTTAATYARQEHKRQKWVSFAERLQDKNVLANLINKLKKKQSTQHRHLPNMMTNLRPSALPDGVVNEEAVREPQKALWENGWRLLDRMTVHARASQICISIVLMFDDDNQDKYNGDITNSLAASLFDGWVVPHDGFEKMMGRHKKTEIEGLGDGEQTHYFYEAQCSSDRPAWILESSQSGREVFHMYNAMGLARQHPMLQTLLARVYVSKEVLTMTESCNLAASFFLCVSDSVQQVHHRYELISEEDETVGHAFTLALAQQENKHRAWQHIAPEQEDSSTQDQEDSCNNSYSREALAEHLDKHEF